MGELGSGPPQIHIMDKHRQYEVERLLFRRQFVMGPQFVKDLASWSRLKIRPSVCLTVHPDLNAFQVTCGGKSITLLGYMLDPRKPEAKDCDIIEDLMHQLSTCDSLAGFCKYTYELAGRWILIVDDGGEIMLFNDPMGLRQVFFTNSCLSKEVWCASQPGIIAEHLNLEMDSDAVTEYMNSNVYRKWKEHLWPVDSTPYREITHLLPNHYLNVTTGRCHRYWPDAKLERASLVEAVQENSKILKSLMKCASKRFKLGLALTAGWDTRLILASCTEIRDEMYYFTLVDDPDAPDATIPPKLLSRLGLRHESIYYPMRMDEAFQEIYERNVTTAHEWWGRMAQGIYSAYPHNRVFVKGNAAEITRVRFRLPEGQSVTTKSLARFTSFEYADEMEKNSYVIKHWEQWLSGLGEIYNIHILDLFYWEHWAGNFAAMAQSEWDIVQDVFTPYNCRRLLMNMLSVDEKYRNHDEPILYKELILNLWPEVLSEAVNPEYYPRVRRGMRERVRDAIRERVPIHLLRLAENIRDRVVG